MFDSLAALAARGRHPFLVGALSCLMLVACATGARPQRPVPTSAPAPSETFAKALSICRFFKGGRPNRRRNYSPRDPYIASCLQHRGWTSDGTPLREFDSLDTTGVPLPGESSARPPE